MKHLNYADKIKIAEKVARKNYDDDEPPKQLNFQRIFLDESDAKYEGDDYYIAEYMKDAGDWLNGTLCFSNKRAENIYKNGLTQKDIDEIDLTDTDEIYENLDDFTQKQVLEALQQLPYFNIKIY